MDQSNGNALMRGGPVKCGPGCRESFGLDRGYFLQPLSATEGVTSAALNRLMGSRIRMG